MEFDAFSIGPRLRCYACYTSDEGLELCKGSGESCLTIICWGGDRSKVNARELVCFNLEL